MRKIRFLLLLLVTIVTQGARAQECTHQNLSHYASSYDCLKGGTIEYWICESCYTAFKDAECTEPFDGNTYKYPVESHNFDFSKGMGVWHCQNEYCTQEVLAELGLGENCLSNDGIETQFNENRYGTYYKTVGNYPIYRFVAPRTGKLVIKDITEIEYSRKPIAISLFNSNWEYKDFKSGNNYEAIEFSCNVEEGQEYFIGIRAKGANEKLLDETFLINVYCENHNNIEHHAEVQATCDHGGNWGYFVCNDCGGTFSYTDPSTACDVNDFIVPRLMHMFKDGKCVNCDYEVQTLSLTKNDEGIYTFDANVDFDSKSAYFETSCTLLRVYVPEHGDLTANAFVDSENGVEFIEASLFEDEEWLGDFQAKGRRATTDPNSFVYMSRTVNTGWMYIAVYNSEVENSKLQVFLTPHEVKCLQEHVDATCTETGLKAVYECQDPSCGWIFTEDGSFDTENIVIPTLGHHEDETGVCTHCNQRIRLVVGENIVTFPVGENKKTAFKYMAPETKRIDVIVDTDAQVGVEIITWDEWDCISDNDESIYSAKGRRATEEPESKVAISKILQEGIYAIVFTTTAEEAVPAIVALGISDITCPEVTVGENTVKVAAADIIWGDYYNPKTFNIYPFKPTESGIAHIYTVGDYDTYGVLFDYKMEMMTDNDDIDETNRNLGINISVEKGLTYYIGVRGYVGDYIGDYTLKIEVEGLPTCEGTLKLATVGDDGKVTEKNPAETISDFFEGQNGMFKVLGGVTYKRNANTSRWGTVVLPYRLYSNEEVTYYELTAVGNSEMVFSPVETVASNTPTVYRFNNEASSYQYDASTTETTEISWQGEASPLFAPTKVDGWATLGLYNEYKNEDPSTLSQMRYISHDKFMKATSSLTIPAYRAIFVTSNDETLSAKSYAITIDGEGTATDIKAVMTENGIEEIDAIYDINGSKLRGMKRGMNIIRTADGKVRKVINK